MLNKKYNKGIIGLNYVSLAYGLVACKQGNSALIIDDQKLSFSNNWYRNLGYLERSLLLYIGDKYDIEPLKNIDNYITDQNIVLCLNNKQIELVNSPYSNIKEVARKLPDSFSEVYKSKLREINAEDFDREFFNFLDSVCEKAYEKQELGKLSELFLTEPGKNLSDVFTSFKQYLQLDSDISKQLHFILQVMYQTVFSSSKLEVESEFLLLSLLSPRYEIVEDKLKEDLLFEYRKTGGDIKSTNVKDWGIEDNQLKYILLNTIDGLIELDRGYFFSHLNHLVPFETQKAKTDFKSINLECVVDHKYVSLYKGKRFIFSTTERMGSDFPYWEFAIDTNGLLKGIYSYADYTGTKSSFYYHHAIDDIFNSLKTMLPGLVRADWVSRVKLFEGKDTWFEFSPDNKKLLVPKNKNDFKYIYDKETNASIKSLYQCGPARAKSLGFYSYLLDVFS